MSATRGALRLGRSAVLGTSCLLLSLAAHVLAGGQAPSPLLVLVLAVPVACAAVLVTGARAGLPRIAGVLALTQLGLHQAFMALAQPGCSAATLAGHPGLTHQMSGHALAGASCPLPMPMPASMAATAGSAVMVAGHVLAAAGTALLLWHGERLLWTLLGWLGWAIRPLADPRIAPRVRLEPVLAVRRRAEAVVVPGGVGRRGPPVPALS